MKKVILSCVVIAGLTLFFSVQSGHAASIGWGENYIVPKGDVVKSNLYVAGQQLTLMGNIFGDVLGGGGNVFINNDIQGDVMIVGGTINLISSVSNDVRLAGATIVVSGKIGGDLAAIGNNIRVVENTSIGGDALLAGGTIVLSAPVSGKINISGADVTLNGKIEGDANVVADRLTIGPNALINGKLVYKSVREAVIDENAKILGGTLFQKVSNGPDSNLSALIWSSLFWVKLITLFVSSMILFAVGKKSMSVIAGRARINIWQNLIAGFVFLIGAPVSALLLIMTVIGLPLAGAAIGLGIIFIIISLAFMPILLGTTIKVLLKKGDAASWKAILLGSLIISLLGFIPFLGYLVYAGLFLASLGVMIRMSLIKLQSIRS